MLALVDPGFERAGAIMDSVEESALDLSLQETLPDNLYTQGLEGLDDLKGTEAPDVLEAEDFSSDPRWQEVVAGNQEILENFDRDLAEQEQTLLARHADSPNLTNIMDEFFEVAEQQQKDLEMKCSTGQYEMEAQIVGERLEERRVLENEELQSEIGKDYENLDSPLGVESPVAEITRQDREKDDDLTLER